MNAPPTEVSDIMVDETLPSQVASLEFDDVSKQNVDESRDEDDEDEEEGKDDFDMNGLPVPRLSSSTIPIIVEVSNAHRTARFYTNPHDPLFQGICLYSSSSPSSTAATCNATDSPGEMLKQNSDVGVDEGFPLDLWKKWFLSWKKWFLPSVFRHLWRYGRSSQQNQSVIRPMLES
jgi:hypothetical protein